MPRGRQNESPLVQVETTAAPVWWAQLDAIDDTPQPPRPDEFTRAMYAERRSMNLDEARDAIERLVKLGKVKRVRTYKRQVLYQVVKAQ